MRAAFTLLELLVAVAVVAVLAAVAIPATSRVATYNARTKSISNLRQIGVAAHLYANEHSQQLPGQPDAADPEARRWPALFCEYLSPSDPRVFLDSTDLAANRLPLAEIISNQANNTAFVYNGFGDLVVDRHPPDVVPLVRLEAPSQVVLLAQKSPKAKEFYVDPLSQTIAQLLGLLNQKAYDDGSYYLFVDGSVRYIKQQDATYKFWLTDKGIDLPLLPPLGGSFAFN